MNKKWYSIVDTKADVGEVSLFQEIGAWGIPAAQFVEDFKAIRDKKEIHVYINSPGGDVMDGMTIYNTLSSVRDKVIIEVFGWAASIASVIALAGSELIMDEGSYFIIHNPFTASIGDAAALRKDADKLDIVKGEIVNIYSSHSGLPNKEIEEMMDAETWLISSSAVEKGFATSVNKKAKAVDCLYNMTNKGFNKVPKNLQRPLITLKDLSIREIESTLRDVGFSNQEATTIASKVGVKKENEGDPQTTTYIEILNELKNIF